MNKIIKSYYVCRNWFRDSIFEPIWYRFFGHKFHIVKTKLTPSPWYDTDTRILYAVMGLVEWFAENDIRMPTQEEYEGERERINEEEGEYKEDYLKCWEEQYETNKKIMGIYYWWKLYDHRQEEIEKSLNDWHNYEMSFIKDPDDFLWAQNKKSMTEEEKKESKRLLDYHWELENKLRKEEQEYLKLAIELREHMWS